jgi:hypothetical protein
MDVTRAVDTLQAATRHDRGYLRSLLRQLCQFQSVLELPDGLELQLEITS